MIAREHHVEVVAQALWLRMFGERRITAAWTTFAHENPNAAAEFRAKADEMLCVHEGQPKDQPGSRTTHHTSLGWLY
jgi:hypothetical protein